MKYLGIKLAIACFGGMAVFVSAMPGSAQAYEVIAKVNLSSQTMTVIKNGVARYRWSGLCVVKPPPGPVVSWALAVFAFTLDFYFVDAVQ